MAVDQIAHAQKHELRSGVWSRRRGVDAIGEASAPGATVSKSRRDPLAISSDAAWPRPCPAARDASAQLALARLLLQSLRAVSVRLFAALMSLRRALHAHHTLPIRPTRGEPGLAGWHATCGRRSKRHGPEQSLSSISSPSSCRKDETAIILNLSRNGCI